MSDSHCPEMFGGGKHPMREKTLKDRVGGDLKVYYCKNCGFKIVYDSKGNRLQ
jgi:hypothetical protein